MLTLSATTDCETENAVEAEPPAGTLHSIFKTFMFSAVSETLPENSSPDGEPAFHMEASESSTALPDVWEPE